MYFNKVIIISKYIQIFQKTIFKGWRKGHHGNWASNTNQTAIDADEWFNAPFCEGNIYKMLDFGIQSHSIIGTKIPTSLNTP